MGLFILTETVFVIDSKVFFPPPNSETASEFTSICTFTFEKEKKGDYKGLKRREYSDENKPR
jgi:hypothetical protein